jgi:hypothetical protein
LCIGRWTEWIKIRVVQREQGRRKEEEEREPSAIGL